MLVAAVSLDLQTVLVLLMFSLLLIHWGYAVFPQDPLAYLYEQQENLDTRALAGFGQQVMFCHGNRNDLEDQYKSILSC